MERPTGMFLEKVAVRIPSQKVWLEGELSVPEGATDMVLFAHGSGSSRHSPRNQYVAQTLQQAGLGTLLMDLLTPEEERLDQITGEYRFDIDRLARRLADATRWLQEDLETHRFQIHYFGASTGAAAALFAAARLPAEIKSVVSRGGRPDLAQVVLPQVKAATLLIVGGDDYPVVQFNQAAYERLQCEKQLVSIPGATHLFEEPGALEEVARLASDWFLKHGKKIAD